MKEKVALIFDIPRGLAPLRSKIHRQLNKINAEKIQDSVWTSNRIDLLIGLADEIRSSGASAQVLKIKVIK
jgi:hypothetical protein